MPALFLGHVREDPRLLGLPDPPCRLLFKRKNWRGRKRCGLGALQKMNAQGVARCFVQGQAEIIEVHHLMEPACQLMEQRGQIAVRDDRLRNGQQAAVPLVGGLRLCV